MKPDMNLPEFLQSEDAQSHDPCALLELCETAQNERHTLQRWNELVVEIFNKSSAEKSH